MSRSAHRFPVARLLGAAWLAVWIPAYWQHYGPAVFLNLCDIAVVLTVAGLWRGSALVLSMQALSSLVIDGAWVLDLVWRSATGGHLLGGTEYMWDPRYALWLRLLSLFHLWLPVTLVWALRRTGYDRRAWAAQTALALVVVVASRALGPVANSNFAFRDPFLDRAFGPWPVHVLIVVAGLAAIHAATHVFLARTLAPPRSASPPESPENRPTPVSH
jgi:hypothetical protein